MRKSTQVAIGGLSASLCVLLMFMTGLMPFATYALPAIAGAILITVVIENGAATAWIVYFAVSLLSIFIVPDKEAALMFIAFFGYYPILKEKLELIKSKFLQYFLKFSVFNVAIVSSYFVIINIFGFTEVMGEMGDFGKYGLLGLLLLGNITFLIYDFALTNLLVMYLKVIRKNLLRKIK
ncbi:MAG: hypothetical protein RSD67_03100 [Oscillospiraceae bacterium]